MIKKSLLLLSSILLVSLLSFAGPDKGWDPNSSHSHKPSHRFFHLDKQKPIITQMQISNPQEAMDEINKLVNEQPSDLEKKIWVIAISPSRELIAWVRYEQVRQTLVLGIARFKEDLLKYSGVRADALYYYTKVDSILQASHKEFINVIARVNFELSPGNQTFVRFGGFNLEVSSSHIMNLSASSRDGLQEPIKAAFTYSEFDMSPSIKSPAHKVTALKAIDLILTELEIAALPCADLLQ